MDNEGRVFTPHSSKVNVGKERPVPAAVRGGQAGPQVREKVGWVIFSSTGRARRRNEDIFIWIV